MVNFFGLDFAFAKNGFVMLDENASILRQELIITTAKQSDEERLIQIEEKLYDYINKENTNVVYLEGLSFGSKGQSVSQIGAVHYLTRLVLYKNNIPCKIITPAQLKKFVTGKGQAQKNLMLLKIYKRWGVEFEDDNLADAYSLARMALEEYKNEQSSTIKMD